MKKTIIALILALAIATSLLMVPAVAAPLKTAQTIKVIHPVVLHRYIATRERPKDGHSEWITALEVGKYTAWLASDEASMVTGSIIRLYQYP